MTDTEAPPPSPPGGDEQRHTWSRLTRAPEPGEPDPDRMDGWAWARLAMVVGALVLLTAATGLWGLVVVLGLVAIVFLHELGHFIAAKRAGMRVTEFFLGFGPRVWSFRRGETEYGLKLIPAGAYVRIIGMHNLEEVEPADEARTYRQKRFRSRLSVVIAGVAMNFLVALVLIYIALVGFGVPDGTLFLDRPDPDWRIVEVLPDSAAAQADLRADEKIVAVDGRVVEGFGDLRDLIEPRANDDVVLTVERGSTTRDVETTIGENPDEPSLGYLGVVSEPLPPPDERVNPIEAVPQTFAEFGTVNLESLKAFGRFFAPSGLADFGDQLVTAGDDPAPAEPDGNRPAPRSAADDDTRAPGENRLVSLIGVFGIGTQLAESGVVFVVVLFVLINISLGLINLVPLLPFDGGHVAIAAYEKLQEMRQRRSARYFADVSRLLPLTYFVVLVLVGIFVTTIYLDLADPLTVPQ